MLTENDKKDIVRAVESARDPIEQCKIEAQLRCIRVRDVENILCERGIYIRHEVRKQTGGRRPRISDDVLKDMVAKGYSVPQISEATGYKRKNVYERLAAIRRKEARCEKES